MATVNKISFSPDVKSPTIVTSDHDERTARKMSGSSDDSRTRRLSNSSGLIPEDGVWDPNDPEDKLHKQDWSKTTDVKDSWAHQERRRKAGWKNTDVATYRHQEGRRGSVFSMWAPGKDKDGNDILAHNDDKDDAASESTASRRSESFGSTLKPTVSKESRRGSNAGSDRRGSVLSLWKGGKDAKGNDILADDDEWAR